MKKWTKPAGCTLRIARCAVLDRGSIRCRGYRSVFFAVDFLSGSFTSHVCACADKKEEDYHERKILTDTSGQGVQSKGDDITRSSLLSHPF